MRLRTRNGRGIRIPRVCVTVRNGRSIRITRACVTVRGLSAQMWMLMGHFIQIVSLACPHLTCSRH